VGERESIVKKIFRKKEKKEDRRIIPKSNPLK
jgi:hypothetical protein